MAELNHWDVQETSGATSNKSQAVDDGNAQMMTRLADSISIPVSTTSPVVVARTTFQRGWELCLEDDTTPPTANFTVRFNKLDTPSHQHTGLVKIKNNTSYSATLEVDSQVSPKPVIDAGQMRLYDIRSTRIEEGPLWAGSFAHSWLVPVRAASTANVAIASGLENNDLLDGVTLATGDRVLLKNQTTASENGIYVVVASGAASRATDFDTGSEVFSGVAVHVEEGTSNGDTNWQLTTNNPITVDTTNLTFAQLAGSGGTIHVKDGGTTSDSTTSILDFEGFDVEALGGDEVRIKPLAASGGGAFVEIAAKDFGAGSAATWNVDVTGWEEVHAIWENIGFSTADRLAARLSDDGSTYDAGTNYDRNILDDATNTRSTGQAEIILGGNTAVTTGEYGRGVFQNAGQSGYFTQCVSQNWGATGDNALRWGRYTTARVDTHIQFRGLLGNTINAGQIRVLGVKGPKKYCIAGTDGTQTGLNFSTAAAMPWNNDDDDPYGWHDPVTNNSRITPTGIADGHVNVSAQVQIAGFSADEHSRVDLYKNGTLERKGSTTETGLSADQHCATWLRVPFSSGDYYEIYMDVQTDTSVNMIDESVFIVEES